MMIDFTKHIKGITDWTVLGEMPTGKGTIVKAMKEQYDTEGHGVYQLIESKDVKNIDSKTFVHADIGYTGMSTNVFSRAGGIKTAAHNAGKMVHQKFKNPLEDIYIRYIFVEADKEKFVEDSIHKETAIKFKYNFKWRDASAGNDGVIIRIMSDLDKVDNPAELINIIMKAESKWTDITLSAAKEGMFRDMMNEYFSDEAVE